MKLPAKNQTKHNPNWSHTPDHPYRMLIIGGSGPGRTNALLNLIYYQPDIGNIYPCTKDPYGSKYRLLIRKLEDARIKH